MTELLVDCAYQSDWLPQMMSFSLFLARWALLVRLLYASNMLNKYILKICEQMRRILCRVKLFKNTYIQYCIDYREILVKWEEYCNKGKLSYTRIRLRRYLRVIHCSKALSTAMAWYILYSHCTSVMDCIQRT